MSFLNLCHRQSSLLTSGSRHFSSGVGSGHQPLWLKLLPHKKLREAAAKRNCPTLAVITLQGIILSQQSSFGSRGRTINLANCRKHIDKAFKSKRLEAVVLNINSPGGSPVQSELVAEYIMTRAKGKSVPVYSFVEDMAASGGYWLACAGQKIFLSSSSIVGSIGVVTASFGLQDAIGRLGIERRVQTAGKNKVTNDPFGPWEPKDKEKTQMFLDQIHANFINHVKNCRGSRLNGTDEELFNGDVWVGKAAVQNGIADEILTLDNFVWKEYGGYDAIKVEFFNQPSSPFKGLFGTQYDSTLSVDQLLMLAKNAAVDKSLLYDETQSRPF